MKLSLTRCLETFLTCGLFGISAVLSVRLFWQLAGSDRTAAYLLATVAVLFEGSKVFLWLWGVKNRAKGAVLLALLLVGLSLFASLASALAIIQKATYSVTSEQVVSDLNTSRVEELRAEIQALGEARDALPPDWVTARERYEGLLRPLREELKERVEVQETLAGTLTEAQTSAVAYTMFDAVGSFFSRDPMGSQRLSSLLRMLYLLAVAVLLEVVGLVMAWYEVTVRLEPLVYTFILIDGIVHIATENKVLCGKPYSQTFATKQDRRMCPSCALRYSLLKLHSR